MNESRNLPTLTHNNKTSADTSSCSLISIIPNLGMSSCRGRAEAFARSLSSKLRTLGSQSEDDCAVRPEQDEPILNGEIAKTTDTVDGAVGVAKSINNNWTCHEGNCEQKLIVTVKQPLRHDTEAFFDFDCELESPGSPVDECEYLRLNETASNTPHNSVGETSGYICTSTPCSSSSTDATYYDVNTEDITLTNETFKLNGTLTNNEHENEHEHEQLKEILTVDEGLQKEVVQEKQDEVEELLKSSEVEVEEEQKEQKEHKIELTESLLNGHYEEKLILSAIKLETELTESNNSYMNNINDRNHTENAILELIKTEIFEIKTEIENIKTELPIAQTTAIIDEKLTENSNEEKQHKGNFSHSGIDTTDDEDECRPQRVRRCSSLKTGKTPPGTPGRKKIVRFADKLGLDLADIKTFLDEIPNIPKSAFEDLEINDPEPSLQLGPKTDKLLVPLFQQPGGLPTFLDLVRERQVSLENAAVTDHINQTITGSVRVRNLDFNKSVHIRYTLDHWRSFADLQANYVENSCDGFSDKFSFILFGNSMQVGQRLEFAVRFQCKGQQFWDNNYGINYCFQCLPANNNLNITIPITTTTTIITAAAAAAATTTTNISTLSFHTSNHLHTNNNNNNQNLNLFNSRLMGMGASATTSNRMAKPHNGLEQDHAQNQVLRLLSPSAGDAWCSSFY